MSNEIVHEVDTFSTFAKIAGAAVPQDRAINGVDQTDFLPGKSDKSSREGLPVFVAERLGAVKWRDWKLVFYEEERDWWSPPIKLGVPKLFNLITDPKEEYDEDSIRNTWVATPALKIVADFEASMKKYPPIAPGTPDPYKPLIDDPCTSATVASSFPCTPRVLKTWVGEFLALRRRGIDQPHDSRPSVESGG